MGGGPHRFAAGVSGCGPGSSSWIQDVLCRTYSDEVDREQLTRLGPLYLPRAIEVTGYNAGLQDYGLHILLRRELKHRCPHPTVVLVKGFDLGHALRIVAESSQRFPGVAAFVTWRFPLETHGTVLSGRAADELPQNDGSAGRSSVAVLRPANLHPQKGRRPQSASCSRDSRAEGQGPKVPSQPAAYHDESSGRPYLDTFSPARISSASLRTPSQG